MSTLLLAHPDCRRHAPPAGHPERPERLDAVLAALQAPEFAALLREEAPLAPTEEIARCHPQAYIAAIREAEPAEGLSRLDPDTWVSPGSFAAARRAVGANLAAVDAVLAGRARSAFCAVRPPGHHAERARAMGFCLFGNLAIAAKRALDHHGLERVAIVDFDVHHGNGTQDLLWEEPRVLFISTHQMPLYPGTGSREERGAHGQIRNLPLAPGTDGTAYRRLFEAEALPALDAFRPELVLFSAGFDAHADDPLAALALTEADFAWITRSVAELARIHAGGRMVSTLEGGYDLAALAASVAAHVRELMSDD